MVVAAEPFVIFSHRFRLRQMQAALFALDDQRGGLWFSLVALVTQAVLFALLVAHEVPEKIAEREPGQQSYQASHIITVLRIERVIADNTVP